MAFRSSAVATSATGGNLTATPAGVALHDYLAAIAVQDGAGSSVTQPSGWNATTDMSLSAPDGQTIKFSDKDDASGSDSFTFAIPGSNQNSLICAAWSGRDSAAPRSTAPVVTLNTASNASPVSASYTGITASQNDDIAVLMAADQTTAGDTWTYSPISGYTERQDGVATNWVSGIALDTLDAVSAGATGALTNTITGATSAGYAAIVVAIKAAAGGATAKPPKIGLWGRDNGVVYSRPGRQ